MTDHAHNRKRLSSKVFWGGIGGLLLLLGLAPVLTYLVWSSANARRVAFSLQKISAAGEPVNAEELDKCFPLKPGVEDCTKLWMDGLDAVVQPQNGDIAKCVPFIGTATWDHVPKQGTDFPEFAVAEKYLATNELSLQKFHEAGANGGYGRFPVDYSKGFMTLLPYTQNHRSAARLLRLEFELKCRNGDIDGAAKAMDTLLVASRVLENEPTIVSQLVVFAINSVALSAIAEKVCVTPFNDDQLRGFQSRLRTKAPSQELRLALLGERAMGHAAMKNPALMGTDRPLVSALNSDFAFHLDFMDRYIEATQKGFPEAITESQKLDDDLKQKISQPTTRLTIIYSSLILPAIGAVTNATARLTALLAAGDAGIAVELYRREKGKLPTSLTELAPQYIPTAPMDPYSGKPMLFKVDENGFTIYSVGKNQIDDGATLDPQQTDVGLFFSTKK